MSAIKLSTPSSGSISLSPANTASNLTITVPAVTGTMNIQGPAFSAYQSSAQTLSSNTVTKIQFQTEEFDTANCFDSTTNYRFTPNVAKSAANTQSNISLFLLRNSTQIIQFDYTALYTNTSLELRVGSISTNYLDSPATTSATTYKVQFNSNGGTGTTYVQRGSGGGAGATTTSTITLMEIAA